MLSVSMRVTQGWQDRPRFLRCYTILKIIKLQKSEEGLGTTSTGKYFQVSSDTIYLVCLTGRRGDHQSMI